MYDLFFLSYEEPFAEQSWVEFKTRFPHAKRVHGVKGILAAHQACAKKSFTSHFYVVDADNDVDPRFEFNYKVPEYDRDYVHLWYARNPVNLLEYGWGGLKLFPKKVVLGASSMTSDMTTSFDLKIIPKAVSTTHFNKTPFDTWRSAFRECAKLQKGAFKNNNAEETLLRLNAWVNPPVTGAANWEFCVDGAISGKQFAEGTFDISQVNDWEWLKEQFKERFPQCKV